MPGTSTSVPTPAGWATTSWPSATPPTGSGTEPGHPGDHPAVREHRRIDDLRRPFVAVAQLVADGGLAVAVVLESLLLESGAPRDRRDAEAEGGDGGLPRDRTEVEPVEADERQRRQLR